ncbi:MAG: energy-coupling factor transporter ATPase [Christensenellaceae bacterium]|jgi:energy-coupling factor transport system ATP-binding protein|nr:energy-coupling factor transporter ATPase [Christensenellaceae bacterium]
MALIDLSEVFFQYEGQTEEDGAVRGVSFGVNKGEWLSIIGHNGSGKSTLIKLLNGLYLPTSGEVKVEGISSAAEDRIWELRKKVGMIFQNPDNQLVATVVEEDVAFGLENLGVPPLEIQGRVKNALEKVRMGEFAKHAPHHLSGGQKQRVAIAGILAMEPEVLLMDEPTAMLDPSGRKEVLDTVLRLHEEQGITVVHVTHFMEEALAADRVLCMDEGKIALSGSPREVFLNIGGLHALGLEVPPMAELSLRLRKKGLRIPETVMSIEEMTEALCQLKSAI